ncbi:uncharacterized protein [Chiloscyllium punctatum]|uniref:uncharacterized protein n=1 Tax=Chiloscyllium punctatum TaxID=137246 RepID=UPI003B6372C1
MELSTISSEHAESSAYKFVSVEQTVTPGSQSTNESTLPVFSIESTVAANTSSITSALFMQLSTSWSSDSTGPPNNAQGNHWRATHASMDVSTTAPSSIGTNDPSPDVSEDGHSTASSIGSNWLYSDVSEDMYSTAPSIGTNNPSLDVLEDVYSTTRSSIGASWPSPDVSESMYSTATSSIGANYPSPDVSEDMYSTAPSIGSNWLSSDVSDMYSTAASIRTNYPSPDVSEDMYFVSIGTNYQSSDVSDVYSTARSSIGSNWPSPDVSEDMYSTAPSSIGANYPSPDVSEDMYSTPSPSIGTNWPPSVSEGEHCTSVATTWSSTSVEFSTALPYRQPSIGEDIAITSEFPGDSEYFSRTSSTLNFQPSVSGAESVSSNWERSISEELSTSMDSTSYVALQTSSIIGSYLKTSDPGMQLFTMVTSGLEPEGSSLTIESSQTASYTHSSVIRNPLHLQFEILNQNYTDTLSNKSSEAYKELEAMVKATLDPIFSARYGDRFLETKVLSFANGSVKVKSELVFQNDAVLPSSSDVVRTVLTHMYRKDLVPTDLEIDTNSVVCNGYSVANLVPEKMTIEFTALSTGFGPWSDDSAFYPELLEHLKSLVVETLEEKYLVQEFDITRAIRIQGDVNILGTALLITSVHIEALQLLTSLVNDSVDLRSLKVNGSGVNVGVLPISFLITNRKYNSTLRDSRSAYFCSLGKAVTRALQMILQPKYGHFVQAVIKQFGRGSVFVTSDLVFFNNPPSSHEVLDLFFSSVNSRSVLAGTDFAVDPYSFFVGGARLDRPYKRIHFPGFGIAIILLCGLAIVSLPILAFLCWKYRFCAACQKSFTFEAWDVERENASNIPLPEVNRESYRLREATYVNYSFNS